MQETLVRSLGWEDPLEKGKSTHSSILAWRIPWTVQSRGLQRVGHDWATFTFTKLPGHVGKNHILESLSESEEGFAFAFARHLETKFPVRDF